MKATQSHSRHGFTLVELLAAIAVLAMLLAVVFATFNQASKAWELAERRTEVFQDARLVVEQIAAEMESMMTTNTPRLWATAQRIPFRALEGDETGGTQGLVTGSTSLAVTPPNDAIFFVSNRSDSQSQDPADLAEYGYFVVYAKQDAITMQAGQYYLLRHRVRSDNSGYDFFTNNGAANSGSAWFDTPAIGTAHKVPILDNVLRFELRYQYSDAGVSKVSEEWNGGGSATDGRTYRLPSAIHLRLSVIDRRYAGRLAAIIASQGWTDGIPSAELYKIPNNEDGDDVNDLANEPLKNILREGLHTFYRTICLKTNSEY
jgi:prepilin-type N-terminal cleavage/methylation domain-containing protein